MVEQAGPVGPNEKEYVQEYRHSADLFKQALDSYKKSDNMYQQDAFKDVMKQAMQVLNDSAQALTRKELIAQNKQIEKDFQNFQKFPKDPDTQDKLESDLAKGKALAKKSSG
jgi:hypothetical protein